MQSDKFTDILDGCIVFLLMVEEKYLTNSIYAFILNFIFNH
jgi:hypothetical protein